MVGGCRCRQGGTSGAAELCPLGGAGGPNLRSYVPFGWSGLFRCLGAQRPGGPPARRGPHFSREMGRKRAGGKPPGPPVLWPARCHSLILAWWGALFRSMGYYGAHLCALIWDASSCRAAQPRGFPLGGKLSPKVTDEGATGLPNGAEENFRWGDRREPPFSTSTRKGWVQNRPLIRPGFAGPPSPQGEGFG